MTVDSYRSVVCITTAPGHDQRINDDVQLPTRLLVHQLPAPGPVHGAPHHRRTSASTKSTLAPSPASATTSPTCWTWPPSHDVAAEVAASGLRVRSVNGDIGDLNAVLDADGQRGPRTAPRRRCSPSRPTPEPRRWSFPAEPSSHEPVRSLEDGPGRGRRRADPRRAARSRVRRRTLDRIAALPPVLLEPRACRTARPAAGRIRRRDRHGLQPHRGRRRGPARVPPAPCGPDLPRPPARRRPGEHQPQHRQRPRDFAAGLRGTRGRRATPAISRSNSKPATSPTTNARPRPPRPPASSPTSSDHRLLRNCPYEPSKRQLWSNDPAKVTTTQGAS